MSGELLNFRGVIRNGPPKLTPQKSKNFHSSQIFPMVLISRRKPHFFSKKTHHFGSPAVRFSGRLFNQKPLRRALWREGSSCGEEILIQKPSYGRVVMLGPCPKISVVEDVTHAGHVDECEKSQGIPCCTPLMIIPVAIPEVCPEIFLNLCWL